MADSALSAMAISDVECTYLLVAWVSPFIKFKLTCVSPYP